MPPPAWPAGASSTAAELPVAASRLTRGLTRRRRGRALAEVVRHAERDAFLAVVGAYRKAQHRTNRPDRVEDQSGAEVEREERLAVLEGVAARCGDRDLRVDDRETAGRNDLHVTRAVRDQADQRAGRELKRRHVGIAATDVVGAEADGHDRDRADLEALLGGAKLIATAHADRE